MYKHILANQKNNKHNITKIHIQTQHKHNTHMTVETMQNNNTTITYRKIIIHEKQ